MKCEFNRAKRYKHKIKATIKKFVNIFSTFGIDIKPILLTNYIESVIHSIIGLDLYLIFMDECLCKYNPYWS